MAEIVNLRMARKAKQRAGRQEQAAANRSKFGQTKAAKDAQRLDTERAERQLDGARRETD